MVEKKEQPFNGWNYWNHGTDGYLGSLEFVPRPIKETLVKIVLSIATVAGLAGAVLAFGGCTYRAHPTEGPCVYADSYAERAQEQIKYNKEK